MNHFNRRDFLARSLAGGAAALLLGPRAVAAESRVDVVLDEPIGTILPDLYGHFIEHLGGVIYDGIWVGENSKIPNVGGIRKALVDRMLKLKRTVMRWPGGCFADSYNWRDGVGPRSERPRRSNFWLDSPQLREAPDGPWKYDSNHFGTNEFMRFCRLTESEPYFAVNLRSLPAKDFYEWVEYCNAPAGATTLSDLRASQGDREPYRVKFWGVGNESWGCGGNFTGAEYAVEYRRFIAWVPRYGVELAFIPAGPSGGDVNWTRDFFSRLTERSRNILRSVYGWALHYYCGTTGKGNSLDFSDNEWYELLGRADRMDSLIKLHWSAMGEFDPEHQVKLVVDEWGAWHRRGTEVHPSHLFGQTSSLRDALVAALTLDTFNRHADKVVMGNVAQLINCLHSLFLAHEDKFVATPNYHVFEMYKAHYGGKSVRTVFSAPTVSYQAQDKPATLWGLAGSASLQDKRLVLSVVNPHATEARETEVFIRGASVRSGQTRTLVSTDLRAHNSFANPSALEPKESPVKAEGRSFVYAFPPASVTVLTLELA
jgi:alpha-N-arabinofuranosidase